MAGSVRERYGNRIWLVPLLSLLVLLIAFATYEWVIPRTNLEIETVYHEGIVGGGTGGSINVNVILANEGNREIEDLNCRILIREKYGVLITEKVVEGIALGKGENTEVKIHFRMPDSDSTIVRRRPASVKTRCSASAECSAESGFTYAAASPHCSRANSRSEVTRGTSAVKLSG